MPDFVNLVRPSTLKSRRSAGRYLRTGRILGVSHQITVTTQLGTTHRLPVNAARKSSLAGSLMSLLICFLINGCQPKKTQGEEASIEAEKAAEESQTSQAAIHTNYRVVELAQHIGCCDGSAGVALDDRYFLVANDENSVLRIYARSEGSKPLSETNVRKFLDLKKKDDESDLEGMTRIGSTVYVIASHARSKDGDKRKGRRQLFALTYSKQGDTPFLRTFGEPYTKLLQDLEETSLFEGLDFDAAGKRSGDDEDGLNIEGLASTPEGGLLIGFRHPIHLGATILVTIENPQEIMLGDKPIFSAASQLLLGGMGIRGLERYKTHYFLTTESNQGKRYPQLFAWDGISSRPKRIFATLPRDINPESILIFPDTGLEELHILSDDGNEKVDAAPCNEADKEKRRFRRIVLRSSNR